jgi:5-dehydro-2-deoxygluconokinase
MNFSDKPVLVMGRAGMDLYADPPGAQIATARSFTTALGGSSANIAAGLARQSVAVGMLGCVSDDAVSDFVNAQLDAYRIDRRHMRRIGAGTRTSLAIVETRMDMGRVLYRNNAADLAMDQRDVDAVNFADWGALVTTGTVLAAEPARAATLSAFARAGALGLPLVFDIDWRPESWPAPGAARDITARVADLSDIIVGNDTEFGVLAGSAGVGLDAARRLVAEGAHAVIYKMGERGAICLDSSGEVQCGIYPVTAIKPVGAGDAFLAGLLAALIDKRPLAEAVQRGAASAAIVVSNVGCAPASPTRAELDQFMRDHPAPV